MSNISKPRSIDFLTPEQLQRKREGDRKSQRQHRERTRAYIDILERRVRELESKNQLLENDLSYRTQYSPRNDSLSPEHSWQPPVPVLTNNLNQDSRLLDDTTISENQVQTRVEDWEDHQPRGCSD